MIRHTPLLVAAALVALSAGMGSAQVVPNPNPAGILAYRNATPMQVIVLVSVTVNGQQRNGQPHVLNPGEAAWDQVVGLGLKVVTVYDPKTQKPIGEQRINFAGKDQFFIIQADPATKGRVRLVQVPDPRGTPGAFPGMAGGVMPGIGGVMPGASGIVPGFPGVMPGTLPGITPVRRP